MDQNQAFPPPHIRKFGGSTYVNLLNGAQKKIEALYQQAALPAGKAPADIQMIAMLAVQNDLLCIIAANLIDARQAELDEKAAVDS